MKINIDHTLMSFHGYNFETENNDTKSRVGTYMNFPGLCE
jgi:hypothetical protein